MTNKRAFRAESGLDAGGHNVQNVANPRVGELADGVNVQYFIDENTIQPFSATRNYDAQFAVHHLNRIWIAKQAIAAGPFDSSEWESTRVDPTWKVVTGTPPFASGGYALQSGDYINAYSVNSELDFMLPSSPTVGDTIVIQDEGDYCHIRFIRVYTSGKPIDDAKTVEAFTIPGSTKTFVYSSTSGGRWICHTSVDGVKTEVVNRSSAKYQLYAGGYFYRKSSTGRIQMQLPKYANDRDVISTYDLDGMTPVNGAELHVHPDSDHFVERAGTKSITTNATGQGNFIFDASTKVWNIWDGDIRARWKPVNGDVIAYPMEQIAIAAGTGQVNVTLPKDAQTGDFIKVSNIYNLKGVSVRIRVDATSTHKIIGSSDKLVYPKYKDLADNVAGYPQVTEMIFSNLNHGAVIELYYNSASNVWLVAQFDTRVEHVDETNRDRPGVAPLASQAEVDKNHENSPRDDMIVTPKTLANSVSTETRRGIARIATAAELQVATSGSHLNDVIVTPKRLNERQATETIRGVAEVATQSEANTDTNDTHIVTPKKLNARRATQAMAGTVRIISSTATAATSRSVAGVGVYDWSEPTHTEPFVLTPKSLNQAQATENSRGVGYIATQSEANTQGSGASDAVFITPKKLDTRRATEGMAGIAELATQDETNTGTDDTRIITPKKLNDRRATESLHGLAEIATQAEVDAGTDNTRIITPLKFKVWQAYDHFTSTRASGIKHTGSLWDKVVLNIDVANESQRGTLEVATQGEANDMTSSASDIHIVTPKKLSARKATETLTGIAELATQAEVDAEADHTRIVTPKTLGAYIHSASNATMTEGENGTAHAASLAETWVGNDTAGSTQATGAYNHFPLAVTPRGLNHALANYLPKKAKAADADLLDGLNSTQFLRSDTSGTLTGNLTVTGNVVSTLQHKSSYFTIAPFSSGYGKDYKCEIYFKENDNGSTTENYGLVINAINRVASPSVSKDLNIWLNGRKVYHQGFKPTPNEIGAYTKSEADTKFVDAAGDTMTGALKIQTTAPMIQFVETDSSNKSYYMVVDGGSIRLNVDTTSLSDDTVVWRWIDTSKELTTPGVMQATKGFKIGSTVVVEPDAKIHWNKLKSVPAASVSVQGIVKLNDSLNSTSVTEAATPNAIRILKEILDEKAGIEGAVMNDLKIKNWIRIGNVILRPNASNKTLDFVWTDDPM